MWDPVILKCRDSELVVIAGARQKKVKVVWIFEA